MAAGVKELSSGFKIRRENFKVEARLGGLETDLSLVLSDLPKHAFRRIEHSGLPQPDGRRRQSAGFTS